MAAPRHKYSVFAKIKYRGRLIDVLDRIRAIRLVVLVHIEQDLGEDRELIKITVVTPYPPKKTFQAIRQLSLGKIEELQEMTIVDSSLTKY